MWHRFEAGASFLQFLVVIDDRIADRVCEVSKLARSGREIEAEAVGEHAHLGRRHHVRARAVRADAYSEQQRRRGTRWPPSETPDTRSGGEARVQAKMRRE